MRTVLVRYKVHQDKVAENERLVHGVFDELRANAPAGVRYATYKLEDGVSFVHVATVEMAGGSNPLTSLAAFQTFQENLDERCAEAPHVTDLYAVDGYGFPATP